jgi:hypothetical protein
VIFDGIADSFVGEAIDFYSSREAAEAELVKVLRDAPELAGELFVEAVDFAVASAPNEGPAWERVSL